MNRHTYMHTSGEYRYFLSCGSARENTGTTLEGRLTWGNECQTRELGHPSLQDASKLACLWQVKPTDTQGRKTKGTSTTTNKLQARGCLRTISNKLPAFLAHLCVRTRGCVCLGPHACMCLPTYAGRYVCSVSLCAHVCPSWVYACMCAWAYHA